MKCLLQPTPGEGKKAPRTWNCHDAMDMTSQKASGIGRNHYAWEECWLSLPYAAEFGIGKWCDVKVDRISLAHARVHKAGPADFTRSLCQSHPITKLEIVGRWMLDSPDGCPNVGCT